MPGSREDAIPDPLEEQLRQRSPLYLRYIGYGVYDFGVSGLWQGLFIVLLPVLILGLVPEESKNTRLGELRFISQTLAILVQPMAGLLSDRYWLPGGRRLPYMLAGTLLALAVLPWLNLATSFLSLVMFLGALQVAINLALGPFNALIRDNLPWQRRGAASSVRVFLQTTGTAFFVILIGFLAGRYTASKEAFWLWSATFILGAGLLASLLITFALVRETRPSATASDSPSPELTSAPEKERPPPLGFVRFLTSRFCFSFSIGVIGTYGLFYLRDKVRLENPAQAIGLIGVIAGATAVALMYPAGLLSDRVGRRPPLLAAGILGLLAIILVLLAQSSGDVFIIAILVGMALGLFLGPNWALATDLAPRRQAGLYLGLTNIATAGGPMIAGLSGRGVDFLNARGENLGYVVMVAVSGLLIVLGSLLLLTRKRHQQVG